MIRGLLPAASAVFVLAALGPAQAAGDASLDGYLQESVSVRTGEGDVIFHRQTFNGKFEANFSKWLMMRIEADVWRDDPEFLEAHARGRLREGYLRMRMSDFDLRLGRVEIAWGEADGIIVSDQVSPFDIENFIVPGFDEIRKGVDGAFLDYYFPHDVDLQLLWISHFEPPDFPNPRSPWYPIDIERLDVPPFTVDLQPFTRPANTFENSEFGARVSGHPRVADWSLGYLRSWDKRPALHIVPGTEPTTLLAIPEHDRFHLFTFNFAYPTHGVLLKSDTAFEHDRVLQLAPPSDADPSDPDVIEAFGDEFVARHDLVRTLLGLDAKPDVPGWSQADASFQYVHEEVFDPHPFLAIADSTDLFSVLLRASYRNDTIKPWIFAIVNARGADMWVQAKVDYEPFDDWRFSVEYDLFEGHEFDGDNGGIFGMFDENDMFEATVRYSF